MSRPSKLSANVFLELPPILSHYLDGERNLWLESFPNRGKFTLLDRPGCFEDLEAMAVERRQWIEIIGYERTRALCYRIGFEQGRRDAVRHFETFGENSRLALQFAPVYFQLQGRCIVEPVRFEFDLDEKTLYRELLVRGSVEASAQHAAGEALDKPACWKLAGYLSGHVSEVVGRRALTLETVCAAGGGDHCRFVTRLELEWGDEAEWARQALAMESVDAELARRDKLITEAQNAARQAQRALNLFRRQERLEPLLETLIAESEGMQAVIRRARQVAQSETPVLIVGEAGSGRESLARALHASGIRKEGPMVTCDCIGMDPEQLNRELFGFAEGTFPGAPRGHAGAFARGHQGTLFLNDIAQLSLDTQGRVLRALEEKTVRPLGAEAPVPADVRLIAASTESAQALREAGKLRDELYYALTVAPLEIPPLRERQADVLYLAEEFIRRQAERQNRAPLTMSEDFKHALMDCAWPGNIRQLRQVIEHAVLMAEDDRLDVACLPDEILTSRQHDARTDLSKEMIEAALRKVHGNKSKAAKLLGVGRTTLWRAMKKHGI